MRAWPTRESSEKYINVWIEERKEKDIRGSGNRSAEGESQRSQTRLGRNTNKPCNDETFDWMSCEVKKRCNRPKTHEFKSFAAEASILLYYNSYRTYTYMYSRTHLRFKVQVLISVIDEFGYRTKIVNREVR